VVREGDDNDDNNKERESQREKWRHRDKNEEISSYPEGSDCNYNTSDKGDKDLRPAKRRKLPPTPTNNALTPPDEPTPVDNVHHQTSQTSQSPSITVELAPVAEYQEWPFQGFLKCTKIGNKTTFNLEF
jgi:hypothetical protein